jgi:hypothetical protein
MEHQGKEFLTLAACVRGTPFSPLIFLLVIEVLSTMFRRIDDWALLQPLGNRSIPHRVSLYANDMVLFVAPR